MGPLKSTSLLSTTAVVLLAGTALAQQTGARMAGQGVEAPSAMQIRNATDIPDQMAIPDTPLGIRQAEEDTAGSGAARVPATGDTA